MTVSLIFKAWLTLDARRIPSPKETVDCPICPSEEGAKASLMDAGLKDDSALYQCTVCKWHQFALPHFLNWPSYCVQSWLWKWRGRVVFFFTGKVPWHLKRTRKRLTASFFRAIYRCAHSCSWLSIVTMRRNSQGNVAGHSVLSRIISIVEVILFSISLPHLTKIERGVTRKSN